MMERKPPVAELHAKKSVKLSSHHHYLQSLFLQACDGAEVCIVSCHKDRKVWDGLRYHEEDGVSRTSKLSEVTGLTLTDLNIEDEDDGVRVNRQAFISFPSAKSNFLLRFFWGGITGEGN